MVSMIGMCSLVSGEPTAGLERQVRLRLAPSSLTVQEAMTTSETGRGDQFDQSGLPLLREISLCRDHRGSFGFSVRGGCEHRLPVFVSHIHKGLPAFKTKALFVGDSIVRIDQANVEGASHSEVVSRLKNAGQQVTLVVRHFRTAARLLRSQSIPAGVLPLVGRKVSASVPAAGSTTASTVADSSTAGIGDSRDSCLEIEENEREEQESPANGQEDPWIPQKLQQRSATASGRRPASSESFSTFRSVSSSGGSEATTATTTINSQHRQQQAAAAAAVAAAPTYQWVDMLTVPLKFGKVSRYLPSTDLLRQASIEVVGLNGHSSGCLSFTSSQQVAKWYSAIHSNIQQLIQSTMAEANACSTKQQQVFYMNWLGLTLHDSPQRSRLWQDVFVAVRGDELLLFEVPPIFNDDWRGASVKEKVYRCVLRVLDDDELLDRRRNAFFLHVGGNDVFYMSAETVGQVAELEKALFKATSAALAKRSSDRSPVMFKVTCDGVEGRLAFDLEQGICFKSGCGDESLNWSYQLSLVRRSCDDRNETLFLHFAEEADRQPPVVKQLRCLELQLLLIVLHAFLSSRLSTVDPLFLGQSSA